MSDKATSERILRRAERLLRRRELGPLLGLGILLVIFGTMSGNLFSTQEISAVTSLTASIGTVAIGVTFLMISGEFDLSVGATFALAAVVFGKLLGQHHWNDWGALVTVLAIAAGIGLVNGLITTQFGIPSFITTLASLLVIQGLDLVVSGGNTILFFGHSVVRSALGGALGISSLAAPVAWFIGLAVVMWFVLERTSYGNWSSAAGGRAGVARAMGVPTKRVKTINFVVSSMLAAFAGIAQFASFGAASANDGQDYELFAIVAAVIGGTSLFGVTGTLIGTFIGALILSVLQTGLLLVGVPGSWYTPLTGVILVLAVILNVRLGRLNLRALAAKLSLRPGAEVPPASAPALREEPRGE